MKIHLICWARNEADVLEAHVRHHASFVTSFTYVIHRSRDNSTEILEALATEGLPVRFSTDERLLHGQENAMTGMMRDAAGEGADWILPLDADEFLYGDVRSALVAAAGTVLHAPWRGYVPMPSDDPEEPNVLRRIAHRRSSEQPEWTKILIPRSIAGETGAVLAFGNHSVRNGKGMIEQAARSPLAIAHFPVRSERQFRRKIYGGWLSHLADPARKQGMTFQWEAAFRDLKERGTLTSDQLREIGLHYADATEWESLWPSTKILGAPDVPAGTPPPTIIRDPVPCNFALRHEIREADPVTILMETAEALAKENASLARNVTGASAARAA